MLYGTVYMLFTLQQAHEWMGMLPTTTVFVFHLPFASHRCARFSLDGNLKSQIEFRGRNEKSEASLTGIQ